MPFNRWIGNLGRGTLGHGRVKKTMVDPDMDPVRWSGYNPTKMIIKDPVKRIFASVKIGQTHREINRKKKIEKGLSRLQRMYRRRQHRKGTQL
jgi:hypothetical protein